MTSSRRNRPRPWNAALIVLLAVLSFVPALAVPGTLDTSFAKRGWVPLPYNTDSQRALLAVQRDGAVVTAGTVARGKAQTRDDYEFRIQRFTSAGTPDRTFGRNGTTRLPYSGEAIGMAIQRDGKIIVALCDPACRPHVVRLGATEIVTRLFRFTRTGTLDQSFGSRGVADLHTQADYRFVSNMILQRDGKIVVVGSIRPKRFADVPHRAMAMRFLSNGQLDSGFGAGGLSLFGFVGDGLAAVTHEWGYSATQRRDGRIVVAGSHAAGLGVAQLTPDGSLDHSFGTLGRVSVRYPECDWCGTGIVLDRTGNATISSAAFGPIWSDFVVTRLAPNGTLDRRFGGDGSVFVDFGSSSRPLYDVARSVALDASGRVIVAGTTGSEEEVNRLALTRLTGSGAMDRSFGRSGRVIPRIPLGDLNYDTWGSSMALWRGKIVLSGKLAVRLRSS